MSLCCEHAVLSLHIAVHAVLTVEVGQARQHFLQDERNEVFTEASPLLMHGFYQVSHSAIGAVLQAGRIASTREEEKVPSLILHHMHHHWHTGVHSRLVPHVISLMGPHPCSAFQYFKAHNALKSIKPRLQALF